MGRAEGMGISGLIQGFILMATHYEAKKMNEQKRQLFFYVSDSSWQYDKPIRHLKCFSKNVESLLGPRQSTAMESVFLGIILQWPTEGSLQDLMAP